ncbi:MAG: hypothetical protein HY359_16175 [Candidatus Rokubacteria bacterium]|nr:hypothetical protein [Candidatus Rokubacteria bacterium]
MIAVEQALREALVNAGRGEVAFRRDFQGFPGTVHGGAVAALFYRATTPRPPVQLRMELLRGVPTETALRLTTGSAGAVAQLALAQGDRRLAGAELACGDLPPIDPTPLLAAWQHRDRAAAELPGTATCLACGSANPLGLGVRFLADARFLWREYVPPESYRAAAGSLHPALVTVLLDELGWWLGALAQQECGVTTEVSVSIFRPLPFAPLLVLGDRAAVRADDDPRGRYVRARGCLLTDEGTLLAACEVRFAGSAAYTRRLLQPFLETTEPERLFRLFPNARSLGQRDHPGGERPN